MVTWSEQVALVTGAARGIGRAVAKRLARHGASVCVNYANSGAAAELLIADIRASGGRAFAVAADVADEAAVKAMVAQVNREAGDITILVNNAGLGYSATLDSYDVHEAARRRRVNVDGMILVTRAVADGMRRQRFGRIVNIGSVAGFGTSRPGNAFYAGNKAEVHVLTRRFAMELGPDGITVNSVAPGVVKTDMTVQNRSDAEWEEASKPLARRAMLGTVGSPDDVANAVAFFASPESGWVTAQVLAVDGGRMDFIGH
jgi:NAD(P)-dependent dehydrogenase (short-subunit alcohol dehydrogenase family)